MGLYDRDYVRGRNSGFSFSTNRMVTNLIIVNCVVFVLDVFFFDARLSSGGDAAPRRTHGLLALQPDLLQHPWDFWQLLTYGFVHDPSGLRHLAFNMLGLFFLGYYAEEFYGKLRFFWFYLTAIVVSGLGWLLMQPLVGGSGASAIGASGAVTATMVVSVLLAPHRTFLFWGVLPIPAWGLLVLSIGSDLQLAFGRGEENIAWEAHLAGALYGYLFFTQGWSFGQLLPRAWSPSAWLQSFKRPRLKVHRPSTEPEGDFDAEVDRVLEKISIHGQDSLSGKEKKLLAEAAKRARRKLS